MQKIILFLITQMLICSLLGQNFSLRGAIIDAESKIGLENATITVFRLDSTLITYTLSDKNGNFYLSNLTENTLFLNITYIGYENFNKTIKLSENNIDTIKVSLSAQGNLNTVVVKSVIPIKINRDTLEINPDAFKMKSDAVIEELLNKVQGVIIWSDGSITFNGKLVKSLLVDGKNFLGSSDPRIVTQNLPKGIVDKIKVYQEYDRRHIGRQLTTQDSILVMNIKLKENKKNGYFGKITMGYGTDKHYENDLSIQMYNKKRSFSIGGGLNNTNKDILNIQEIFKDNTYRNSNPNLYNAGRFGNEGISNNQSIGAIYTQDFNDINNSRQINNLTANYNNSASKNYISTIDYKNQTSLNNSQSFKNTSFQNNKYNRNDIGVHYVKTDDYNHNFEINGNVVLDNSVNSNQNTTEVKDKNEELQSNYNINSYQKSNSNNESVGLIYAKNDNETPYQNIRLQFSGTTTHLSKENEIGSIFHSYIDGIKDTSYKRRYQYDGNGVNVTGDIDYAGFKRLLFGRFNFFNINLSLGQWFSYNKFNTRNKTDDIETLIQTYYVNKTLTYNETKDLFEYTPYILFGKNYAKQGSTYIKSYNWTFKLLNDLKYDINQSSVSNRNLKRDFSFFRYETSLGFQLNKIDRYKYYFDIYYKKNWGYPSIDKLYTITDSIYVYNITIGNPLLKTSINHKINFNATFYTQNPKSKYQFMLSLSGEYDKIYHPIIDSISNDPSGKRYNYFTNASTSNLISTNYNIFVERKFGKSKVKASTYGLFSINNTPIFVDNVYSSATQTIFTNHTFFSHSLDTWLNLSIEQTFEIYKTKQNTAMLLSYHNNVSKTQFGANTTYQNGLNFGSTLSIEKNSSFYRNISLWNFFAIYRFLQQQVEVKIQAMDILRQYKNVTNGSTNVGTYSSISNGLQQYFLLSLSYYPRKFGKKK